MLDPQFPSLRGDSSRGAGNLTISERWRKEKRYNTMSVIIRNKMKQPSRNLNLKALLSCSSELQAYKLRTGVNSHNDVCKIHCTSGEWLLLMLECLLQPSPAMAYFLPLPSLLASVGVIRELKQHDAAMRRQRTLAKCLFNFKIASLITDPIWIDILWMTAASSWPRCVA